MFAIPATPPAITMNFAPHVPSAQSGGQERQRLHLKPNQVVRATVSQGGLDRVELELGKLFFRAWTRVPLRTGQSLLLQVQDVASNIELRIINQDLARNLMQRLHLFGSRTDLVSLVQDMVQGEKGQTEHSRALETLFQGLIQSRGGLDGKLLSSLDRLLGLDAEARLSLSGKDAPRDSLKMFLYHLLHRPGLNQTQLNQGKHLFNYLELLQLCRAKLYQDGILFLPLPFSFLKQGFALLERRGSSGGEPDQEDEQEVYRINLFLQLQRLGNLEVQLLYEGMGIHVRFLCQDKSTAEFISGLTGELRSAVGALPLGVVSVGTGALDPDKALIERVLPECERFVDSKA